ncbi:hypothetical protein OSTOST_18785, partial [Ostertagia ostertagi]
VAVIAGVGTRDPLAEYRREEQRLKNTNSPFEDMPRRGRLRSKPPTPPPRDRSRSPARSERATPSIEGNSNATPYSSKSEQHIPNGHLPSSVGRREPASSILRGIVVSPSALNDHHFQYADTTLQRNNNEPPKYISGQERVAAAIYRAETPQRELYASGTIHRSETPNRYFPENSTFARSETPAFPILRETPVPFHPLLYGQNGTSRQDLDQSNSLNYR